MRCSYSKGKQMQEQRKLGVKGHLQREGLQNSQRHTNPPEGMEVQGYQAN
jgi:hypothetical protein